MAQLTIYEEEEKSTIPPRQIELGNEEITIGRGEGTRILLENPTVSRQHIAVQATSQGFVVVDLESANGTWVNGKRVDRFLLRDGDEIRLGRVRIVFADPPDPQATLLVDMAKVQVNDEVDDKVQDRRLVREVSPSAPRLDLNSSPRPEGQPEPAPKQVLSPPPVSHHPGEQQLVPEVATPAPRPAPPPPMAAPRRMSGSARASAPRRSTAVEYAGFWVRVLAYLIDMAILFLGMAAVGFGLFALAAALRQSVPSVDLILLPIQFAISVLIPSLYLIGFWVRSGATPGKNLVGIKVICIDGGSLSLGKAVLRMLGYFLSSMIFCIGYIMVAFSERKQGLHDVVAGTIVVRR
ncbi:MAG: FHA domain-containing protein [bacterium]|nr:FHA domain-containing protein [bacterium]